ncbi:MAG: DUF1684 domain-containing protein [Gemmatimonadetes bacterium]|jgi:uncharacterized protein|nr:DUF1684 domain-containing protein [Gemmatimonadota bacterium]
MLKRILFFASLWILISPQNGSAQDSTAAIVAQIELGRAAKDSLLRLSPDSPLPADQRPQFQSLHYFPIDLTYRLTGALHAYGRRRQIRIQTSDGNSMPMERFGRILAQWEGKPFSLEVYRSLEDSSLEVFFKDATNGAETYGGGRYVRLQFLGEGAYLIDFNESYNPYCAYNPEFICPLPPPQNHLPFALRAGEKNYGSDLAH